MPKTPADYIHCHRCLVPLELPIIRRAETEIWFMEFALCQGCTEEMLKMENPFVTMHMEGETLKTLLRSKSSRTLKATVFVE